MELTPEERERIYLEEVERREVNKKLDVEERARAKAAERPQSVTRGLRLLLVATMVANARMAFLRPGGDALRRVLSSDSYLGLLYGAGLAAAILSVGVTGFLWYKKSAGRNWARIASVGLGFIQSAGVIPHLLGGPHGAWMWAPVSVAHLTLAIVASAYLFRSDASAWFRRRRTR
ncbi:hypothetical protein HN937_09675 [Candidatus Poribacteria bacterium]|nr:hypothetical protein [Candidatus Poribacteria bacterium]